MLDRLMGTAQIQIGDKDVVRAAIDAYRQRRADFTDYIIGAGRREAGCARAGTFDRRSRDDPAFQVV